MHSITQDSKLWYSAFKTRYPIWSNRVQYTANSTRLIDWKDFVIHLVKQQKSTRHFSFEFVKEQLKKSSRKRKNIEQKYMTSMGQEDINSTPFWIQDPLVVDIDRMTKTGVVATGKHRKNATGLNARSEHKILFWKYPSWELMRTFELNLTPPTLTCQIIGIQSIRMPTANGRGYQKVRFFSLAVGIAFTHGLLELDNEDRVDIWKSLFVYRLFDDGSTQCVSHIKITDIFLGREVFLFSDTSWAQSNDGDSNQNTNDGHLEDWMKIVSPAQSDYHPRFTVFLLAIGLIYEQNIVIAGCVQMVRFDMRIQHNILDPSITPVAWDNLIHQLVPLPKSSAFVLRRNYHPLQNTLNNELSFGTPTEMFTSIRLGTNVSCMIHFKYPPHLNHLICTGSNQDDELSVYDWRFGIKVGSLPWKTFDNLSNHHHHHSNHRQQTQQQEQQQITPRTTTTPVDFGIETFLFEEDELNHIQIAEEMTLEEEADAVDASVDVRPWGLESTLVLPPYWSRSDEHQQYPDLSNNGFRLIAVGDNRSDNTRDRLEIKVWDISYLLSVKWDPLLEDDGLYLEQDIPESLFIELSKRFPWWPRRTKELSKLALNMFLQPTVDRNNLDVGTSTLGFQHHVHIIQNSRQLFNYPHTQLPYSPPSGFQSMLLSHTFDKDEQDQTLIPVKYTAYNVLYTSLFLLTEDGKVTVMDIETGQITGTVENVASQYQSRQVRGIDVNVVGGREVVVTSKEGLLRGVVS